MMGMPPTLPAAMGQPATQCTGTVLRWCGSYGFIKPDDGAGEDLFCHFSSIKDGNMLKEGAPVTFVQRVDERKGREQAFDVTGGFSGVDGGFGGFRRGGSGGTGGVTGPPPPGKQQGTVSRWTARALASSRRTTAARTSSATSRRLRTATPSSRARSCTLPRPLTRPVATTAP